MSCGKVENPTFLIFHVFGSICFILNTKENADKFDSKVDKGIFLSYSETSKAYCVYNCRSLCVEESVHVSFDDTNKFVENELRQVEDDLGILDLGNSQPTQQKDQRSEENRDESEPSHRWSTVKGPRTFRELSKLSSDVIIGDTSQPIQTRATFLDSNIALISQIEPKEITEALEDEGWIEAMKEELF